MEFEEAELYNNNYKLVISCAICRYKCVLTSMFLWNPKILSFNSVLCYLLLSIARFFFTSRTVLTFCSNIDYLNVGLPIYRHFLDIMYKVQRRRRSINTNALCSLLLLYHKVNALKRKLRKVNSRWIETACPVVLACTKHT